MYPPGSKPATLTVLIGVGATDGRRARPPGIGGHGEGVGEALRRGHRQGVDGMWLVYIFEYDHVV